MSSPLIYLNHNVGVLRDDKVFITYRNSKHFFRKFEGFGLSFDVLKMLRRAGCRKIKIIFDNGLGENLIYESTPEIFLEQGAFYLDGADSQRILPLKFLAQEGLKRFEK